MKNLFLILTVGVIAFSSCSKDDKDRDGIIGTWKAISTLLPAFEEPIVYNNEIRLEITFNADLTYSTREYSNNEWKEPRTGVYSARDGKLVRDGKEDEPQHYTINGNQLVISYTSKYWTSANGYEEGITTMTLRRK